MDRKNKVVQPEGNYYDKYNTTNPIAKLLMKNFFIALEDLLNEVGNVNSVLEAGCGEGNVTNFLRQKLSKECTIDAFDVSQKVILEAKSQFKGINFSQGSIYNICSGQYDLVVCSEVLEHLEYPEKALKQLKNVTERYIILSVPREPIWRILNMLRGKYIRNLGNTVGHIQHWSLRSFTEFLEGNGMKILKVRKPLPWTMLLVQKE